MKKHVRHFCDCSREAFQQSYGTQWVCKRCLRLAEERQTEERSISAKAAHANRREKTVGVYSAE